MLRCDVAIVGGGPAGSTVARSLVRAGLDVVVLDRADFPRHKVCAGWITPAVLRELELDAHEYGQQGRTLQAIRGFRIGRAGGEVHEIRFPRTVSYGIRRCEFDDFLLRRSGARLRLGQPLASLERRAGGWILDGEVEAPLLIGAGGHACPVARRLVGPGSREEAAVVAQETEIELPAGSVCTVSPERPELLFSDDMSGYGWCFHKGEFLNVGFGSLDRAGFAGRARAFYESRAEEESVPAGLTGFQGHAYLVRDHSGRPVYDEGVMLVGDAAGLAYPVSGEGIRPAIESGLLAARIALAAAGDYAVDRLAPYAQALTRRFGPARRRGRTVATPAWKLAVARRMLASPWWTRKVLVERLFLREHIAPLPALRFAERLAG